MEAAEDVDDPDRTKLDRNLPPLGASAVSAPTLGTETDLSTRIQAVDSMGSNSRYIVQSLHAP